MPHMTTSHPQEIYDVIIIGAGQAGLAISYYLEKKNCTYIVLEQGRIAESWQSQRWDSFTLNTPNWMTCLPGMEVNEMNKDQFMTKNEFISYLQDYALKFKLPVKENHRVTAVSKYNAKLQESEKNEYFAISTLHQEIRSTWYAKKVIIASGGINKPVIPSLQQVIPQQIAQFHAVSYRNAGQLPQGAVLVVGSGQSGVQIAEELALSGRMVYLAASKVGRSPRRYRGKDMMDWLVQTGFQEISCSSAEGTAQSSSIQPQVSGKGPLGHTISLQSLHALGVTILGKLSGITNGTLSFGHAADDIRYADAFSSRMKKKVDDYIDKHQIIAEEDLVEKTCTNEQVAAQSTARDKKVTTAMEATTDTADLPDPEARSASPLSSLGIENISSIIWATGLSADYSWINLPVTDENGKPIHQEGQSPIEGLYFLGLPWLRKRKSGLVYGVAEDAFLLSEKIIQDLSL